MCPLVASILGHWSLLLHGVFLKAEWDGDRGCVITSTDNTLLAVTFIYTMTLDFVVLCLMAWKVAPPIGGCSALMKLVFLDGVVYFVVA